MKTLEKWKKGNITDYLSVGDQVDQEMINYFTNILPPRTFSTGCLQVGEPYSHKVVGEKMRARYITFKKECGKWHYAGLCIGANL